MRKIILLVAAITLCSTSAFAAITTNGSIINGRVANSNVANGSIINGRVANSHVANGTATGATGVHTHAATAVAGRLVVR
jgi:ADP-glucose pyrophosphorylase